MITLDCALLYILCTFRQMANKLVEGVATGKSIQRVCACINMFMKDHAEIFHDPYWSICNIVESNKPGLYH